jgi:prepilin-type processing-associated H-X9-DG protein
MAWWLDIPPNQLNGRPWGVAVLSFIEQQSLYDQWDRTILAVNELGPIAQANVELMKTPLPAFVCPSAPGGTDRIYDGSTDELGFTITWSAAPSDYMVTTGVLGDFAKLAYANHGGPGGDRHGALQVLGPFGDGRDCKIGDIKDGTTHTFLIGERTGGNKIYVGRQEDSTLDDFVEVNGGGWADVLNGEHWLQGSLYSGNPLTSPDGGPCAINCTSLRGSGFHSLHPGGCHFLMADGSVQFVSASTDAYIIAAQITREKGEIVSQ